MSFNAKLIAVLKQDRRFVDEDGELVLAAVQDHAWRIDHGLVKLLLADKEIKAKFFDEIEGHWVFNFNTFIEYVSQKNFLDNSYTRFRNRIGLTVGGKYLRERGDVALVWPYKDCVLEGGQTKEEEKRKEIFFNEVLAEDEITRLLAPKVLTAFTRYTEKGKKPVGELKRDEDGVIRENLIVKGNNLLAMHSLRGLFGGRVRLIYIDPPYNTGNDEFGYNDAFNHSSWLTFMRNRLEVARTLLREDGVLFVQIDYRQLAYLKVLLDTVFKAENFIGQVNWQRVPEGRTLLGQGESDLDIQTEYLLIYAKEKMPGRLNGDIKKRVDATQKIMQQYSYVLTPKGSAKEFKRFKDSSGQDVVLSRIDDYELKACKTQDIDAYLKNYDRYVQSVGVQEESSFQQQILAVTKGIDALCVAEYTPSKGKRKGQQVTDYFIRDRKLLFAKDYSTLEGKRLYRVTDINDFWSNLEIQVTDIADEGGVTLRRGKKPEELLERIIRWGTASPSDIVMDFALGSGTTAAVAHKLGYQYVGIEQLDYGKNDSVVRLQNVIKGDSTGVSKAVGWKGGGDFVYCELMKYNEAFMERIESAKTSKELVKVWKEMAEGSFLNWYVNPQVPEDAVKDFEAIGQEEDGLKKQKRLLAELLDKNQLYVNLSEIDDPCFKVSDEDKALNKAFYGEAYNA
ncbi:MAG TPA: site-specific DNA-methyltransferase [Candidatus Latescibacteria bacterium]|nr:site-specific DNA-methyltransferase [Candidatus Latescibacterota bacterium]HPK76038.1 site-specific DNA-methyltransferase [Candidatus Latescibacterota bacterium]